ncbi:unnamed protein product [Schistocephalus solidus]|uniref:Uncharacterized protein n=1 Tax=Schistocephalus solidus TaxID=70667 RepID=A0A183SRR1_SCHSO|nr:unnamed protein product [Schistocephalus solidus]
MKKSENKVPNPQSPLSPPPDPLSSSLSPILSFPFPLPSHFPLSPRSKKPYDNPRSNRPKCRTALGARELARYKVDIATVSETRFSEQGQLEKVGSGYTFFWSGRAKAD